MAKTSNKVSEATLDPAVQALLDQARKAEGVTENDVTELVGLTPIYNPQTALEQKWPALVGYADRIELLPVQRAGSKDEWTPILVRFIATQATKAVTGAKNERRVIDIAPGDEVMLPISGSLGVNSKLEHAAADTAKAHKMIIVVTGQSPTTKGNDMWLFHVEEIPAAAKVRAGDPKLGYPLAIMNFNGQPFPNASPAIGAGVGAPNGAASQPAHA